MPPMQKLPELTEDQQQMLLKGINWLKAQVQSRFDAGNLGSIDHLKLNQLLAALEAKVKAKAIPYNNAIEYNVIIVKIIDTCSLVAKKRSKLESSNSVGKYMDILNNLSDANFDSFSEFKQSAEKLFEFEKNL